MRLPAPFAAALLLLTSAPALAAETPCSTVCTRRFPLCVDVCSVNGEDTTCGDAGYRCVDTLGVSSESTTTDEATRVCSEDHPDGETAEG